MSSGDSQRRAGDSERATVGPPAAAPPAAPQTVSRELRREGVWRWRERAEQWLDFPPGCFLDYGCGSGKLLERICGRCTDCHGVDVDDDALDSARQRCATASFARIGLDGRTRFVDGFFDSVALVEVIEHVPDERATLTEIARILKPGGKLVLTTPHKGLLTFLDSGNFKFMFPRLHRFIHLHVLRGRAYYEQRFVRTRELGLVGDISDSGRRRPWHRHYRPKEIRACCPDTLALERHGVYFPGLRVFMLLAQIFRVLSLGRLREVPWPLSALERRLSRVESRWGDQLVMLFTKRA